MKQVDIVIIGGGSAGMSAAIAAYDAGSRNILILERDQELGGILQQCIHNGFGLQVFHEELSGPAYAEKLRMQIDTRNITYALHSTVVHIDEQRHVSYINREGYQILQAGAIILACGCYERSRGAISIPGTRVKGVYTAGCAQRYLNMENILVGKRVFILGSGDIGLIMARRMTLEGAKVLGVAELMPYSNGLTRNLVQCLQDFDIPLYLSHTVINIEGKEHVEAISIAKVDERLQVIAGSEQRFEVDTLLLSVGLLPENSLAQEAQIELDPRTKGALVDEHFQTSIPHIYACGNALHVHDLVDFVSMEAQLAGRFASSDLQQLNEDTMVEVSYDENIAYVVPQRIHQTLHEETITLSFRVKKPFQHVEIVIHNQNGILKKIKKQVMLPAEMERIKIASKSIAGSTFVKVQVKTL